MGRETYLFGSRYRSTYVFQAGKNGEERLQAYTLLVWGSSFLKILVFQGKDDITLLKQKLSLYTPTELLPSIHFISCSCGPVKDIVHQRYEESLLQRKRQQSSPSQEAYCRQRPGSGSVMPFLLWQNPLFLIIVLINTLV